MKAHKKATFEAIPAAEEFKKRYGNEVVFNKTDILKIDGGESAFRYKYTGPGAELEDIGPPSYAVRINGEWWDFFDGEVYYKFPTPDACFDYLADVDFVMLFGNTDKQLPDPADYK